ncbi:hypothetical protein [uncultured Methanobrevibacter sp.]|uniref:hypothetical protein n=1 Tax=uncultured Methanobrevibacter sp. TaxID=253161 RepID=UPI0025CCB653|nr:hypothetical protein [uncultured Methanobrevibacter sp.]
MHIYRGLKYKFKSNTPSVNVNVAPLNLTAIDDTLKISYQKHRIFIPVKELFFQ